MMNQSFGIRRGRLRRSVVAQRGGTACLEASAVNDGELSRGSTVERRRHKQ